MKTSLSLMIAVLVSVHIAISAAADGSGTLVVRIADVSSPLVKIEGASLILQSKPTLSHECRERLHKISGPLRNVMMYTLENETFKEGDLNTIRTTLMQAWGHLRRSQLAQAEQLLEKAKTLSKVDTVVAFARVGDFSILSLIESVQVGIDLFKPAHIKIMSEGIATLLAQPEIQQEPEEVLEKLKQAKALLDTNDLQSAEDILRQVTKLFDSWIVHPKKIGDYGYQDMCTMIGAILKKKDPFSEGFPDELFA